MNFKKQLKQKINKLQKQLKQNKEKDDNCKIRLYHDKFYGYKEKPLKGSAWKIREEAYRTNIITGKDDCKIRLQ